MVNMIPDQINAIGWVDSVCQFKILLYDKYRYANCTPVFFNPTCSHLFERLFQLRFP